MFCKRKPEWLRYTITSLDDNNGLIAHSCMFRIKDIKCIACKDNILQINTFEENLRLFYKFSTVVEAHEAFEAFGNAINWSGKSADEDNYAIQVK